MADVSPWLESILSIDSIASVLNSAFLSSLTGALAGAFAGAWAAQKIAERSKERDHLAAQIRNTNAAIMVAFSICNTALALKSQFIKNMHESFVSKRAELTEMKRALKAGEVPPGTEFEFKADFRVLQMPLVPIDILRTQIYEKLSIVGRPLALVSTLSGVLSSLEDTIINRNNLIDKFKVSSFSSNDLSALYFGFPLDGGHTSTEYADTIESLDRLTDDAIFFSELLSKDLMDYGRRTLEVYKARFKGTYESIQSADFSDARQSGLMPSEKKYEDWLNGFKKPHQDKT